MPAVRTKPKMVSIEIIVDNHEHKGVPCKPDDIISVTEDVATWLIDGKKGKTTTAKPATQ